MSRPRLLDLFCGAGGAAVGYWDAGFVVVGVDIKPQPRYPFEFYQMDALRIQETGKSGYPFLQLHHFDAIHASPPCQAYSAMSACRPGLADEYPALIEPVRAFLQATGIPWVIENVEGAPLADAPTLDGRFGVTLCGTMFGLDLYRHRVFESNIPLTQPGHPVHAVPASPAGHWEPGTVMSVSGHVSPIAVAEEAMGIDWMTRDELSEAIPPAYTQFIGEQLLAALDLVGGER